VACAAISSAPPRGVKVRLAHPRPRDYKRAAFADGSDGWISRSRGRRWSTGRFARTR